MFLLYFLSGLLNVEDEHFSSIEISNLKIGGLSGFHKEPEALRWI